MDEVQKLKEQVGRLQRRLDQIEGVGSEQAAVAELVSNDADGNQPRMIFPRSRHASASQLGDTE